MPTGTVVWYQAHKGYGFIRPDDGGPDVMVHASVVEAAGRRELKKGEEITYEATQLPKKPAPIVTRIAPG
ncbi:cold-shock DNA-binding protein family [Roseomonas rosea]|jgi:CspA family cold shock protein|uniref:Cold-shock DNA-binding protein family n=1 Tax=Muricoccus roseus TaxID=198092 RepID=A0A1M6MJP5_9PROT|nr:cold shock domain-containing protein [Roseomonas rosea]SHJ83626.1 cold-shock DNA-binding protein family [Roseomonas rosea]